MEYIFDAKQLEKLIKFFIETHFADDNNFKIVKEVKFVEVEERDGLIEYRIFLELKDEISKHLKNYASPSNFLTAYNGYALYGYEVEKMLPLKDISDKFGRVDVYRLFDDIKDFMYTHLGLKLHPTLCATYFFFFKKSSKKSSQDY